MASQSKYVQNDLDANWTNSTNAQGAPDGSCTESATNNQEERYDFTGDLFTIPAGATIDGFEVTTERACDTNDFYDIELLDSTSTWRLKIGTAGPTGGCGSDTAETLGANNDLWGGTWTVAWVNSTSFQVLLRQGKAAAQDTTYVDSIQVTIHYTTVSTYTQDFDLDAYLLERGEATVDSDSFLLKRGSQPVDFDAVLQSETATYTKTFTVDAVLQQKYWDVEATADDGHIDATGYYNNVNWDHVVSPNFDGGVCTRFPSVNIPQGAQIVSAYWRVTPYSAWDQTGTPAVIRIKAFDEDNSTQVSNRTDFDSRDRTVAYVDWTIPSWGNPPPAPPNWKQSPNIKSVVQEIVDRTSWSAGNALQIVTSSTSNSQRSIVDYTYSTTYSAELEVTFQPRKQFDSDAILLKTQSQPFDFDAVLETTVDTYTIDFDFDAVLIEETSQGLSSDALLLQRNTHPFNSDSILSKRGTQLFDSDAYLLEHNSINVDFDAVLIEEGSQGLDYDAYLLQRNSHPFDFDAVLEDAVSTGTKTFDFDAVLWKTRRLFDPNIFDPLIFDTEPTKTKRFNFDAVLAEEGLTKGLTFDAVLLKTASHSFDQDTWLLKRGSQSFVSDAWLLSKYAQGLTSDAILLQRNTVDFDADSILVKRGSHSFDQDTYLLKRGLAPFDFDAVLQELYAQGVSFDAWLLKTQSATFDYDAVLKLRGTQTLTSDAVLTAVDSLSFDFDAVLLSSGTSTFNYDAILESETAAVPSVGTGVGEARRRRRRRDTPQLQLVPYVKLLTAEYEVLHPYMFEAFGLAETSHKKYSQTLRATLMVQHPFIKEIVSEIGVNKRSKLQDLLAYLLSFEVEDEE